MKDLFDIDNINDLPHEIVDEMPKRSGRTTPVELRKERVLDLVNSTNQRLTRAQVLAAYYRQTKDPTVKLSMISTDLVSLVNEGSINRVDRGIYQRIVEHVASVK